MIFSLFCSVFGVYTEFGRDPEIEFVEIKSTAYQPKLEIYCFFAPAAQSPVRPVPLYLT